MTLYLDAAVEGDVDEAVVERLAGHVGATIGTAYGRKGKSFLRKRIGNYNNAARNRPWLVLVDLDDEFECAPDLITAWLPSPNPQLSFRVAVREVESWLIADRERLAAFLSISKSIIPAHPEELPDPKATIVDLARRSRRREIRDDFVPRAGSGREIGPAYVSRLTEYVRDTRSGWRPNVAASAAASLARCLKSLASLRDETIKSKSGR